MNIFGLRIEFKNLMAETDRSQCTSSQFTIWTPGHQFGPVRDIAQTPRPLTIIAPANPTGLGLLNRPLQHTPLGDLGSCAIKNRGLKTEVPCLIFVCLFSFLLFGFKKKSQPNFPNHRLGGFHPTGDPTWKFRGKKTPPSCFRTRAVLVLWDVGVPLWPPTPRLRVMPVRPEGGFSTVSTTLTTCQWPWSFYNKIKRREMTWTFLHGNNETSVYSMVIPGDSKQLKLEE